MPGFRGKNDINKKFTIDRKKLLMYHNEVDSYCNKKKKLLNPLVPEREQATPSALVPPLIRDRRWMFLDV